MKNPSNSKEIMVGMWGDSLDFGVADSLDLVVADSLTSKDDDDEERNSDSFMTTAVLR